MNGSFGIPEGRANMEELLEILEDLRDDVDFLSCNDLIDGKILNSFEVLQLVGELNDEFDIEIPASEVVAENFNSVEAILKLVERMKEA